MGGCCGSSFVAGVIKPQATGAWPEHPPGRHGFIAGGADASSGTPADGPADTIFTGGTILPIAGTVSEVEAVAVKDGRILAVGGRDAVMQRRGPATEVIDLGGHTLMPGFVEPHVHTVAPAATSDWVNITPYTTATYEEAIQKIRAAVQAAQPGEWVRAIGYDPYLMSGPQALTRTDLDALSTTNPIFIIHVSGHLAYANSRALELAHVTDTTPNPPGGGRYLKDGNGHLTGVMEEPPSFQPFTDAMPKLDGRQLYELVARLLRHFAANGLTTVTDAGVGVSAGAAEAELLEKIGHDPATPVRINCFPVGLRLDEWVAAGLKPGQGDDRVRYTAIKFWSDGSIQGKTGALREPYLNTDVRGTLNYTHADLKSQVQRAHDLDWQVAIHANGDAAVEQVLDVFEAVLTRSPRQDHRHRIDHCTISDDAQMERLVRLGITPTFLIDHVYYWGKLFRDTLLGPERAERMDPTGTALRLGVPFSFHCDYNVTPPQPLLYIQTAVTRKMRDGGEVLGPEHRLPIDEALKAVTIYPAWQLRMDHLVGSLEPGKLADFVVLEQNPRTADPDTIASIGVVETWLGGVRQQSAGGVGVS